VYDNTGSAPAAGAHDDEHPQKNAVRPKAETPTERVDTLFLESGNGRCDCGTGIVLSGINIEEPSDRTVFRSASGEIPESLSERSFQSHLRDFHHGFRPYG